MKNLKICMMVLLLVSMGTMVQAQQSAFQGTWNGEKITGRRIERLEISGNNWSYFLDDVIEAAGTARFSAGRAELLLANGKIYFDLTLLAPGLIEHATTSLHRFRNTKPPNQTNTVDNKTPITIWSFTDELEGLTKNYYQPAHPGVTVEYSLTPTDRFMGKLDPVLQSGVGTPDVFALESDFVRKYVESGQLLDLTDIYEAHKNKLLAYPVEIGTYNGKVYALSWQVCPGAMFYRRSLAKKYLGTDDPKAVQTFFTNPAKFLETAKLLNDKSRGSCVVVSSIGDLSKVFYGLRKNPWVVNGKLNIDPIMEQYLDIAKTLHDNRWEGRVGQWSEGWFAGMQGNLQNERGQSLEVFSYFLPTWGLHYVLKTNAPATSGDWAMIQGPAGWRWGGTWIGAYKNTKNPAAAKEYIRYLTTDDGFLERYAQDSGDVVSNVAVVDKIKGRFSEPFLGGQNHYAAFAEMAKTVNGKLVQGTDNMIDNIFMENVRAFVYGEKTKARALADFRSQVESVLGL